MKNPFFFLRIFFSSLSGIALLICAPAFADPIFLFHWGPASDNAAVLHMSGFPFDGNHSEKINERGSVELGSGYFDFARTHFTPDGSIIGPAFYAALDPFSSLRFGKDRPDLLIVEIDAHGNPNRFGRPVPSSNIGIVNDARLNPGKFESYPLFGTYTGNVTGFMAPEWAGIYRRPNAEETAEGVRVLIRPPEPNDVVRIWDALTSGNDEGKIKFLSDLSRYWPENFTASSRILFDRMFFDTGYDFLVNYLSHGRASSRFNHEILETLSSFIQRSPGSVKARNLLKAWASAPGPVTDTNLLKIRTTPSWLSEVLVSLDPDDRDRVVSELLDQLVPAMEAKVENAFFTLEALGPSIRSSAKKVQFLDRIRPYAYNFGFRAGLGQFDPVFTREVSGLTPKAVFVETWMAGDLGKYYNFDAVRRYLAAGNQAGLSEIELVDGLLSQRERIAKSAETIATTAQFLIAGILQSTELESTTRISLYRRLHERIGDYLRDNPVSIMRFTPDFANSDKNAELLAEALENLPELKAKAREDLLGMAFDRTTHRPRFTALLKTLTCETLFETQP
jgi:hypothetical protein